MLFNSVLYLLFFPVVYLLYWNLRGRARQYLLIGASIVFYAAWGLQREGLPGLRWTIHFAGMIAINYLLIRRMLTDPSRKKIYFVSLVTVDLVNLIVFKYIGFFTRVFFDLNLPIPEEYRGIDFFLPLALSFYTFQLMAYGVDVYRGVIDEDSGPARFFLFILFFPQLIAGPIMRSTDFMDQIDKPVFNKRAMFDGSWLILGGLTKKILLADPMGGIIAPIFYNPGVYDWWSLLVAGMGFSLQVYGDFSGYTDIARGSARLLGYDIPENFLAPFFSQSARELWQRWHITLASWLRDYIYIPLGGSRVGKFRNYINLFITFTLGGLWHGADYTFLAWGAMWGFLLALERFIEKDLGWKFLPDSNRFYRGIRILIMFLLFSIGAIMFRSQKVNHGDHIHTSADIMGTMLSGIFTHGPSLIEHEYEISGGDPELLLSIFGNELFETVHIGTYDSLIAMFLLLFFFHVIQYRKGFLESWRKYDPVLLIIAAALIGGFLIPLNVSGAHQFIYFVF